MNDYSAASREFGWDDEIQQDESFAVLPEGDYRFQIVKFERARHGGSEKIPPCNKAVLTVDVKGPAGSGTILTNLFLHSRFEWKLCQFFTAIGQRRRGEVTRMNWQTVPGSSGVCRVTVRKWTGKDGRERESNEITEFYDPDKAPAVPQSDPPAEQASMWQELPPDTKTPWDYGSF